MREIKFRAWDKKEREMYTPKGLDDCYFYINNSDGKLHWVNHPDFEDEPMTNYELMQYTGLKDKNGKEIFEFDIVKYRNYLFYIRWSHDNYGYIFDWVKGWNPKITWEGILNGECEVIGNRYETPDLLLEDKHEMP